jgi:hypothetical protein
MNARDAEVKSYVPPSVANDLREEADEHGISVSALFRQIIERHIIEKLAAQGKQWAPIVEPGGYVYIVKSGDLYKIGKTISLRKRMASLNVGKPRIIRAVRVADYSLVEKLLHVMFADKRVTGEWFKLSADDVLRAGAFLTENAIFFAHGCS